MDWYGKILEIDGKTYDLSHLAPFSLNVNFPAQGNKPAIYFTLIIRFSTHCVSEDWVDHPSVSFPDEGGKDRFFSFARYNLSLLLPSLLKELPERQCYFASSRNFLTVEIREGDGESKNYHIYFSVKKIREGVSVLVESAYVPNNPERQSKKIKGKVILSNTYHRKKITRSR